ncbi:MAG: cytochrome C, partial [Desulfobacterales bacterium]
GKQPYDKVNKNLTILHLFPKGKDDKDAYWKGYDWNKAIAYGQKYAGLPYSGEYDFVETSYVYPTTHMVAPKDNVVACIECHSADGRLASLAGFYMPGRDGFKSINVFGWILVLGTLVAVSFHGLGRAISRGRKED